MFILTAMETKENSLLGWKLFRPSRKFAEMIKYVVFIYRIEWLSSLDMLKFFDDVKES